MDSSLRNDFSEVYGFLNILENEYRDKISKEFMEIIEKNRNYNYNPQYDINKPINHQKISENALMIITLINFCYWADDNEKQRIKKFLKL